MHTIRLLCPQPQGILIPYDGSIAVRAFDEKSSGAPIVGKVDGEILSVVMKFITGIDALPSPGVNPLEGSPKCSCGKLGLGRRSRLPTLDRSRGSSWEPRD
jgi:hypothetical protein